MFLYKLPLSKLFCFACNYSLSQLHFYRILTVFRCLYLSWILNTSEKVKVLIAQSCLPLCNLMGYSLPGSSVHGILQTGILEWVAIPLSRGSSWPGDWTLVSCIAGRFLSSEPLGSIPIFHGDWKCQNYECSKISRAVGQHVFHDRLFTHNWLIICTLGNKNRVE